MHTLTNTKEIAARLGAAINSAWDELKELVATAHLSNDEGGLKGGVPLLVTVAKMRDQLGGTMTALVRHEDRQEVAATKSTRGRRGRSKVTRPRGKAATKSSGDSKAPSTSRNSSKPVRAKRVVPVKGTYTPVGDYKPYLLRAAAELGGRSVFKPIQDRVVELMQKDKVLKDLDLATSPRTTRIRAYAQMSALLQQMKKKGEAIAHGEGASAEIEFVSVVKKSQARARKSPTAGTQETRELAAAA